MSQQQKLEQVLEHLLAEDSEHAAELLHQIIVEKARMIYESIVDEEVDDEEVADDELDESDEVGGEPSADFTSEIETDKDEVDSEEQNDGEAGGDEDLEGSEVDGQFGGEEELSTEDRVDDLEAQLASLTAEFQALMSQEMEEPNHADLGAEMGDIDAAFGGAAPVAPEQQMSDAMMYEKKKDKKLEKAPEAKDKKKDKKVDEETQFLQKTADTGQKGKAKLVGTGKDSPLGAEQDKSPFSKAPNKPSYGGTTSNILGSKSTGGEYGKWNGDSAKDDTLSDNVDVKPKNSGVKADTTPKYTGGKSAGAGLEKSPFTKKPA